jgi:hypothetical protein
VSPDQQAIDAICREIYRIDALHHATQDQEGDAAFWARLEWDGQIIGLRKALCALFGWPMDEADKEGKADQYVERWAAARPVSSEENTA